MTTADWTVDVCDPEAQGIINEYASMLADVRQENSLLLEDKRHLLDECEHLRNDLFYSRMEIIRLRKERDGVQNVDAEDNGNGPDCRPCPDCPFIGKAHQPEEVK